MLRALSIRRFFLVLMSLPFFAAEVGALSIDWVTVGDPGNAPDTQVMTGYGASTGTTGYGAVSYSYRIGKYEVTNAEYVEFLNAVAVTDTNSLYSGFGFITQSGSSGSYSYAVGAGNENRPVAFVKFHDTLRFANWLHNGQPTGTQGIGTTEGGAYTITAAGIAANSIVRNAGANIFLTSEDEWYKAAYYDAVSLSYFDNPFGTDIAPTCSTPSATPNTANCGPAVGMETVVGAYTGSISPYGAFDMGGNLSEWNESVDPNFPLEYRVLRGGNYFDNPVAPDTALGSEKRWGGPIAFGGDIAGFRVASLIPEPGTGLLVMTGLIGLAARRKRPTAK